MPGRPILESLRDHAQVGLAGSPRTEFRSPQAEGRFIMRTAVWLSLSAIALAAIGSPALAQRGTGDDQGIARSGVAVEPAVVAGTVTDVMQTTCEATTGRSPVGVHLIVETAEGVSLNLHLGPLTAMDDVLAAVEAGDGIEAAAFRTDALADGNYVAKALTVDGETFTLRGDDLRPVWAGAGRGAGQGSGLGRGQGGGMGPGLGFGPCQW